MTWYIYSLKNTFNFSDRASKKEFWMFCLINLLITIALYLIQFAYGYGLPINIYSIVTMITSTSLMTRRLHDIDRSGWWQLIMLVPIIGVIVLLVWSAKDGTGVNRFGPVVNTD